MHNAVDFRANGDPVFGIVRSQISHWQLVRRRWLGNKLVIVLRDGKRFTLRGNNLDQAFSHLTDIMNL